LRAELLIAVHRAITDLGLTRSLSKALTEGGRWLTADAWDADELVTA
jgi:hypothetical protein